MNYIYKKEVRNGHDYVDMSTVMGREEFERLRAIFVDIWERVRTLVESIFNGMYDTINSMLEHYSIEEIERMMEEVNMDESFRLFKD